MEQNFFVRVMTISIFGAFLWLFFPFLNSFVVALLLVIAMIPIHLNIERKLLKNHYTKQYASLISASTMTLVLLCVVFAPILFFIHYIATHSTQLMETSNIFYNQVIHLASQLPDSMKWAQEYVDKALIKAKANQEQILSSLAFNIRSGILGFLSVLGEMILIVVFFFFLLWYRQSLLLAIVPAIPLQRHIRHEFVLNMITTSAAGFYTLLGVSIVQGIAFGLFISFFDGYDPLLLGLMIAVASVIPVVGTALVFVPVALNEWFSGHGMNAFIIVIFSWSILSFFIDNIVRLLILKRLNCYLSKKGKPIDDFLIFFGIMAGLITFGFWGFLIGPAIVALSVTLLRMSHYMKTTV